MLKNINHNPRATAMPDTSVRAPGRYTRPGSTNNSSTSDARSSVPTSIQEGPNTRDHFAGLEYGEKVNGRQDNACLDDGTGTGRRQRDTFRGSRRC